MNKLPINVFLNENIYNVKAFNRTKTAHHRLPEVLDNVAYNEVDSVVYVKNKQNIADDFVAGRKYSYAIECIEGQVTISYQSLELLTTATKYDDLSDEQHFTGEGEALVINSGEIAIFELNEAIKYTETNGQFVEYKIAKDGGIK